MDPVAASDIQADPFADTLLVGGGSDYPCVVRIPLDQPGQAKVFVDLTTRGVHAGIYALAVSHDRGLLALGTRPIIDAATRTIRIPSVVQLYRVGPSPTASPHFDAAASAPTTLLAEIYEPAGVTAVLVGGDASLIVGCADGAVRFLRWIPGASDGLEPVRPALPLHAGPVLALEWLDSTRFVSLGADGRVRTASVSGVLSPASGPFAPVPRETGALASLATVELCAYFGDGAGLVHSLDIEAARGSAERIHEGPILAVAWHPEVDLLVTAGLADRQMCLVDRKTLQVRGRADVDAAVFGVIPLTDARVAVIDAGGRITIWSVAGEPASRGRLGQWSVRSWLGPDVRSLVAVRRAALATEGDRLRDEALAAVASGTFDQARALIAQLRTAGRRGEALLLEAALARREGRLLEELRTWQHVQAHASASLGLAEQYLIAENLAALLCPAEAAGRFRALGAYRDAEQRAEWLSRHPLFDAAGRQNLVRGDFQRPEQLLEELDKCSLLQLRFSGTIVLQTQSPRVLPCPVERARMAERVRRHLTGAHLGVEVLEEERQLYLAGKTRQVEWVRLRPLERAPGGHVEVALELVTEAAGPTFFGYALFQVDEGEGDASWAEHNRAVATAWIATYQGHEGKAWVKKVFAEATRPLNALVSEDTAHRSGRNTPRPSGRSG